MSTHGPINGVKISRQFLCTLCLIPSTDLHPSPSSHRVQINPFHPPAIDDPHKVVKVVASDGKSGDTREISYSNCKVIGNGSFGVVFQAKLVGAPKDGEDIAIKKVLQDKRFKVRSPYYLFSIPIRIILTLHRIESCKS